MAPCLKVKNSISFNKAMRELTVQLVVLTAWCSCAFNANIYSFFLLLAIYKQVYRKKEDPCSLNFLKSTIILIILLQYALQLLSLSSYNSPVPIPKNLLHKGKLSFPVYPNVENYYLYIPFYFEVSSFMPWNKKLP